MVTYLLLLVFFVCAWLVLQLIMTGSTYHRYFLPLLPVVLGHGFLCGFLCSLWFRSLWPLFLVAYSLLLLINVRKNFSGSIESEAARAMDFLGAEDTREVRRVFETSSRRTRTFFVLSHLAFLSPFLFATLIWPTSRARETPPPFRSDSSSLSPAPRQPAPSGTEWNEAEIREAPHFAASLAAMADARELWTLSPGGASITPDAPGVNVKDPIRAKVLMAKALSESRLVSDGTLKKMHPDLLTHWRSEYERGIALLAEGLDKKNGEDIVLGMTLLDRCLHWLQGHQKELRLPQ